MLKLKEINWDKAKEIVQRERNDWYEEYDEAEGIFMGWRRKNKHTSVSFLQFARWLNKESLEKEVKLLNE